jgi:hypothetical protein
MAGPRQNHNLRLIRKDYSYTAEEVAKLFHINYQTVLRWVEDGLPIIPDTRPFLIYSVDLHTFLATRQAKRRHPCASDQMFCLKCRLPRGVKQGTLTAVPIPKFIQLKACCDVCGGKVSKVVKPETWGENHPFYPYIQPSIEPHNGRPQPQPTCQLQKGAQLCLDLTP